MFKCSNSYYFAKFKKIDDIELVSLKLIKSQISSIFKEYKIDAIKIGLLCNLKVAKFIKEFLTEKSIKCPVVVDPVYGSTTGKIFYKRESYKKLFEIFSPLKPVFTPNFNEAKLLLGKKKKYSSVENVLETLYLNYNTPFVVTGIRENRREICDYIIKEKEIIKLKSSYVDIKNTHGTGCVFSTSLSVYLAKGNSLKNSVNKSKKFLTNKLRSAPNFGLSYAPFL